MHESCMFNSGSLSQLDTLLGVGMLVLKGYHRLVTRSRRLRSHFMCGLLFVPRENRIWKIFVTGFHIQRVAFQPRIQKKHVVIVLLSPRFGAAFFFNSVLKVILKTNLGAEGTKP